MYLLIFGSFAMMNWSSFLNLDFQGGYPRSLIKSRMGWRRRDPADVAVIHLFGGEEPELYIPDICRTHGTGSKATVICRSIYRRAEEERQVGYISNVGSTVAGKRMGPLGTRRQMDRELDGWMFPIHASLVTRCSVAHHGISMLYNLILKS